MSSPNNVILISDDDNDTSSIDLSTELVEQHVFFPTPPLLNRRRQLPFTIELEYPHDVRDFSLTAPIQPMISPSSPLSRNPFPNNPNNNDANLQQLNQSLSNINLASLPQEMIHTVAFANGSDNVTMVRLLANVNQKLRFMIGNTLAAIRFQNLPVDRIAIWLNDTWPKGLPNLVTINGSSNDMNIISSSGENTLIDPTFPPAIANTSDLRMKWLHIAGSEINSSSTWRMVFYYLARVAPNLVELRSPFNILPEEDELMSPTESSLGLPINAAVEAIQEVQNWFAFGTSQEEEEEEDDPGKIDQELLDATFGADDLHHLPNLRKLTVTSMVGSLPGIAVPSLTHLTIFNYKPGRGKPTLPETLKTLIIYQTPGLMFVKSLFPPSLETLELNGNDDIDPARGTLVSLQHLVSLPCYRTLQRLCLESFNYSDFMQFDRVGNLVANHYPPSLTQLVFQLPEFAWQMAGVPNYFDFVKHIPSKVQLVIRKGYNRVPDILVKQIDWMLLHRNTYLPDTNEARVAQFELIWYQWVLRLDERLNHPPADSPLINAKTFESLYNPNDNVATFWTKVVINIMGLSPTPWLQVLYNYEPRERFEEPIDMTDGKYQENIFIFIKAWTTLLIDQYSSEHGAGVFAKIVPQIGRAWSSKLKNEGNHERSMFDTLFQEDITGYSGLLMGSFHRRILEGLIISIIDSAANNFEIMGRLGRLPLNTIFEFDDRTLYDYAVL